MSQRGQISINSVVKGILRESAEVKLKVADDSSLLSAVAKSAKLIATCIEKGGTVFACGNGGSTCDAMHLCEELVGQYKRPRAGAKAMHFMDPSTLTCWGNDYGFDEAFARYAETFCTSKDVLVAISTSGNSKNVLAAVKAAQKRKTKVIALTGRGGGALSKVADVAVVVPHNATERIQEVHITCIHVWCELLETGLAGSLTPRKP